VRITVSVSRKEGRPGYSSEAASCELALDLPDDRPDLVAAEIRRAYAVADQAVAEQLASHTVQPPVIEPDRDRLPSQARPPSEPEPERQRPRTRPAADPYRPYRGGNELPRTGRQLFAWSRKEEQDYGVKGLMRALVDFGRERGFADRMTDWEPDQVVEALEVWREIKAEQRTAGQNGHGGGSYR
jgi:hypothetical protein